MIPVDKIFVITLKDSYERQKRFANNFKDTGLQYEWYMATRDKEDPIRGCYNSHQDIIKISKKRGYERILIFEDDAKPINDIQTIATQVQEFFSINNGNGPKGWKFLMLGYLPVKTNKTNYSNILNIRCAFNGHAYIVNLEKVEPEEWDGTMLDGKYFCNGISGKELRKLITFPKETDVYAIYPMGFSQEIIDSSVGIEHMSQKYFFKAYAGENNSARVSSKTSTIQLAVFVIIWSVCISVGSVLYFIGKKQESIYICILLFLSVLIYLFLFGIDYTSPIDID